MNAGHTLHGRYRIEGTLGRGGMGGVYLATHLELDVKVAVKEMVVRLPDPKEHEDAVRQFKAEARILHHLSHPNLPRVYDFFEDGGCHYLVMDFIEGQTLEAMLENGPLSEAQVGEVARILCEVLEYMHQQKPPVIFRDLKPANVMIETSGHLKLIDFGIAKMFEASEQNRTHTLIRSAGTPGFAAPEQYGAGTDERSDVYSLGATLYCCITGITPPASPSLAVEASYLTPVLEVHPEVSPGFAAAIEAMMRPAPAKRPQNMAAVRQLLEGAPSGSLRERVQPQQGEFESDHPTQELMITATGELQPAPMFKLSGHTQELLVKEPDPAPMLTPATQKVRRRKPGLRWSLLLLTVALAALLWWLKVIP